MQSEVCNFLSSHAAVEGGERVVKRTKKDGQVLWTFQLAMVKRGLEGFALRLRVEFIGRF